MSFEFVENVTLELPQNTVGLDSFSEATHRENNKLIIEIAAIHAGLTSNYNMYTAEALEASLSTWVTPYPKPIITNHDEMADSIGRVMASRMDKEADGTPYVRLQTAITDPLAIQKIEDNRFLTGSVGGRAESAKCSICRVDWAQENSGGGRPCRHQRGKVYEGKLAYFELGGLSFKEYSFVNVPADQESGVRASSEETGQWTHVIKMFSLDMNNQSIAELAESGTSSNILEKMKKKDAQFTYTNLKGTFLSVSAWESREKDDEISKITELNNTIYNELDPNSNNGNSEVTEDSLEEKEQTMAKKNASTPVESVEDEEDILNVTEKLSEDLAATVEEGQEEKEVEESEEVAESDELSENSDEETDPAEATDTAATAEEESIEEEQLDTASDEKESEVNGDESAEAEVEEDSAKESEEEEATASEESDSKEDEVTEATDDSVEENELAEENTRLSEENAKLRSALHRMLVERVVDRKISVGLAAKSDRASQIEEHSSRTASSLADSLKDLDNYQPQSNVTESDLPTMEVKSFSTGSGDNIIEVDGEKVEESDKEVPPAKRAEDAFVEVLMDRKRLN